MNKFFKYCLLTALFSLLTISIPFSYCAEPFATESNGNNTLCNSTYMVIDNTNMTEHNDAYYCDILGGIIEVQPLNELFTAYILSTKRFILKIDNDIIGMSAYTLYSLSLIIQDDAITLNVNDTQYKLTNKTFSIEFICIGAFGNFNTEYLTTYHDNVIKLPITNDLNISQGSAEIINGELYLYPEPITEACDTITQHVVYDSEFRLSYYSITNKHCVTETLSIDTDIYTIRDEYKIVRVLPNNADATAEITGNRIKFSIKGEYCIVLTKESYKYEINITVNIPDKDDNSNPPNPDLPPDDGDNDNPDIIIPPTPPDEGEVLPPDESESIPPDNENTPPDNNEEYPSDDDDNDGDVIEPPLPPDGNEDLPPDNNDTEQTDPPIPPDDIENLPPDNNSDGDNNTSDSDNASGDTSDSDNNPPIEEIIPPHSDSSIIDDELDFSINYESKIDYVKVIIVAVGAIFIIGGLTTLLIIVSKIKKRRKF